MRKLNSMVKAVGILKLTVLLSTNLSAEEKTFQVNTENSVVNWKGEKIGGRHSGFQKSERKNI